VHFPSHRYLRWVTGGEEEDEHSGNLTRRIRKAKQRHENSENLRKPRRRSEAVRADSTHRNKRAAAGNKRAAAGNKTAARVCVLWRRRREESCDRGEGNNAELEITSLLLGFFY